MVRDYILHDRGNSIYLGDSFANLPSPIHEGQTIKKLFKFNEDEVAKEKKKSKDNNNVIRIEGKNKDQEQGAGKGLNKKGDLSEDKI